MRFSASFGNLTRELLVHMLTGMSKLSDVEICALVIADGKGIELCAVTDTSSAFGKIDFQEFLTFRVQSRADNVVALEVKIAALLVALRDRSGADEMTLKLTKDSNGNILLTLLEKTLTQITVTQEVPVLKILVVDEMSRYREPSAGQPDATMLFPDVKAAKKVLDRMKQLDKFVQVKADQRTGTLIFRVDTEVVSTRTVFSNLMDGVNDDNENADTSGRRHNQFVAASLNSKELAAITAGLGTFGKRSSTIMIAIVRGSLVCIHVNFDNESTLTFYMVTSSDDDDVLPVLENNQLLRLETIKGATPDDLDDLL